LTNTPKFSRQLSAAAPQRVLHASAPHRARRGAQPRRAMADGAAARKILLCGDVGGSLNALYKRFATVRAPTRTRTPAAACAHAAYTQLRQRGAPVRAASAARAPQRLDTRTRMRRAAP
jgi:hypothetical protein